MNVARRSDGLLSARLTVAMLELIALNRFGCSEEQILRDLSASTSASWSRGRNTISLLRSLGVLKGETDNVRIAASEVRYVDHWQPRLSDLTAHLVADRIVHTKAAGCLQARGEEADLWLDSMLLPGASEGLPLWVIEFSVATREEVGSRFWQVAPEHQEVLLASARLANRTLLRRRVSAAELERQLVARTAQGTEAEEWVLHFEQQRLANHPLADQIKRVSEEDVAAGYDIVSFSSSGALQYDHFIEVKSFAGDKRFFWTRNEIEKAQEFGERYAIYLVDMQKIREPTYQPQIILGPHSALFRADVAGWTVTPSTYECVAAGES